MSNVEPSPGGSGAHAAPDGRRRRSRAQTQEFFAAKAATWDSRFGDDGPAYAAAAAESGYAEGGTVADVGCGTGRALAALRAAVGPAGAVLGLDVTAEMLDVARPAARGAGAALLRCDADRLPLPSGCLDGVFAAGLINHLDDAEEGLSELARVTRSGGMLTLFHPTGRAALAARHGRELSPDEPLAPGRLPGLLQAAGWQPTTYDDAGHRFFALARRLPS